MVKLTPQEQASFVRDEPAVFVPVKGAWGRRGATNVRLEAAGEATLRHALAAAWRNVAPKRIIGDDRQAAKETGGIVTTNAHE
jgi:hypothetical protein